MNIRATLLDIFIDGDKIVLWCKDESGVDRFLFDKIKPLVSFQPRDDASERLASRLFKGLDVQITTKNHLSQGEVRVLSTTFPSITSFKQRFPVFEQGLFGHGIFHDSDLALEERYLFDRDLAPFCKLNIDSDEQGRVQSIHAAEDLLALEYEVPPLRILSLRINANRQGTITSLVCNGEKIEEDIIKRFSELYIELDPDIVAINKQQELLLRLFAQCDGITLNRYGNDAHKHKQGYSFFSYGVKYFRESPLYLKGRFLVNSGSFLDDSFTLSSLIEGSRTCRMRLQMVASHSVGRAVTNLLGWQARQDGYLLPHKVGIYERLKPFGELIECDRGALTVEPVVGLHHDVAELDFVSMYPSIISEYNLSPETLYCSCCHHAPIVGTPYRFCTKVKGIVPKVCDLLMRRRAYFKSQKDHLSKSKADYIKWLLVVIFGFQAYRNKKVGCIEVHEAINALARDTLMRSIRVAECMGYEVVHAIVDSLYVKRLQPLDHASMPEHAQHVKRKGVEEKQTEELRQAITRETRLPIEVKALYQFITFLPSTVNPAQPVPTSYYGVSDTGVVKVRGIEIRKRNFPPIVKNLQAELIERINTLVKERRRVNEDDFRELFEGSIGVLKNHLGALEHATADDLTIKVRIGKERYKVDCAQKILSERLRNQGVRLQPGQSVRYIIEDADSSRYVLADEFCGKFDKAKYTQLLKMAFVHLFLPFGIDENSVDEALCGQQRLMLAPQPHSPAQTY